jgi:hypothetical protein
MLYIILTVVNNKKFYASRMLPNPKAACTLKFTTPTTHMTALTDYSVKKIFVP